MRLPDILECGPNRFRSGQGSVVENQNLPPIPDKRNFDYTIWNVCNFPSEGIPRGRRAGVNPQRGSKVLIVLQFHLTKRIEVTTVK